MDAFPPSKVARTRGGGVRGGALLGAAAAEAWTRGATDLSAFCASVPEGN
jgi:hypothetical protein